MDLRQGRSGMSARGAALARSGLVVAAIALAALALAAAEAGAADRPFTPRFSANDAGDIAIVGNTLVTCTTADGTCAGAQAGNPLNNNAFTMVNVDGDGDPATTNSSAAELDLPADATVLFAGLYWGSESGATNQRRSTALLRSPGGSYETIGPAGVVLDTSSGQAKRYQAFVDVTTKVAAAGPGTYWVADVATTVGAKDKHGGWALVVAYRSATEPPRNLTVFDGLETVSETEPVQSIPVTGFRTPRSGPVRTRLGFVTYEGDRGSEGDTATLNNKLLGDGASPQKNFFNSSIADQGADVGSKNPNYVNQLGFDADLIDANGYLPNNATSAVIRVNTGGETYFPGVITFATELFAPRVVPSKSVDNLDNPGGPARPGDRLRYTVNLSNGGGDGAENVTIADTIPAGATYLPGSLGIAGVGAQSDGAGDDQAEYDPAANRVVYRVGEGADAVQGGLIPPQGSVSVSFEVTVDEVPDGTEIVNRARFDYTAQTLGTPLGGETNETVTPVAVPDLTLSKSHTPPGDFVGGTLAEYHLVVRNTGSLATSGAVTVTDTLPAGAFSGIFPIDAPGWDCSASGGLMLSCTRSDPLGPGATYPTITITNLLVVDPISGPISNTGTVSGGGDTNTSNNSGTDGANGATSADLGVTKVAEPGTVANGERVSFRIEVANDGPSTAQAVTLTDALGAGDYSDVEVTSSQGTCDGTVSCALGNLAPGAKATVTIEATVTANDTTLTNTVTAGSSTPDPDPGNDGASADLTVPPTADLSVSKSDAPAAPEHPKAGVANGYVYAIAVSNLGPSSAPNVLVTDRLPAAFTPSTIDAPGWTCNAPGAGAELACTRPSLAPADGEALITVTGTLAETSSADTLGNSALVGSDLVDPDPDNNASDVSNVVLPAADLDLTKAGPTRLALGQRGTFELRLKNRGPGAAKRVELKDVVPTGLRLLSVDGRGCELRVEKAVCEIKKLPAGKARTVTVRVESTTAGLGERLANTAEVDAATPDPVPPSNEGVARVKVKRKPKLTVEKTADASKVRPGEVLAYTITVGNEGRGPALNVEVCDVLPAGLEVLRAKGAERSGDRVCWTVKRLGGDSEERFRVVAQVDLAAPSGPQRNVAVVAAANVSKRTDSAKVEVKGGDREACRPVAQAPEPPRRC